EKTLDAEGFSRDSFASAFKVLEDLQAVVDPNTPLPDWRRQLPKSSSWWFLVDRYFAKTPFLTTGFATTNEPVTTHAQREELGRELPVSGVPTILSGWSYALADLQPWSQRQLLIISALMALFDVGLLAILYRDFPLWLPPLVTLAFRSPAIIATTPPPTPHLHSLNVPSFRPALALGAAYGIYDVL